MINKWVISPTYTWNEYKSYNPFTDLLLTSWDIQAMFSLTQRSSIEMIITCRGADGRSLRAVSQQPLLHRHLGGTKEVDIRRKVGETEKKTMRNKTKNNLMSFRPKLKWI